MFENTDTINGGRPDSFIRPEPVSQGDDVAIIAPSSGLAALFPDVLEIAVDRLETTFNLNPVIYPTAEMDPAICPNIRKSVHETFTTPSVTPR